MAIHHGSLEAVSGELAIAAYELGNLHLEDGSLKESDEDDRGATKEA